MEIRPVKGFVAVLATVFTLACGGSQGGESDTTTAPPRQRGVSAEEQAGQYMGEAGFALGDGDTAGALEKYLQAAHIYDGTGEITIERGEAHFLAAGLAYQLGQRTQSLEEYDAAVEIYLRFSGNSKIKAANALNNMGTIYKELEEPDKARTCWERALQIYEAAPKELQSTSNMAKIQQNLRDLVEGY